MAVEYEPVIGLEIHVELSTNSKMFCGCKVAFGGEPNTRTCPICLGMPGSLPVINEKSIESTAKIGLAFNCEIASSTQFHRKNYFYPDMPKNYQISQYDLPICLKGFLNVEVGDKANKVGITRVHLEEDTGKLMHVGETGRIAGAEYAQVDFNRAGTPLVEIVSEPDIRSAEVAKNFLQKLRNTLLYLEVSDCNMEEGSLRCDANISIRPVGSAAFGTKVELKNMNSFKAVYRGIDYEINRQEKLLREGGVIVQETRHWDAANNVTISLRSKEEAHDYRYFPEPDLVPMSLTEEWIDKIRKELPELPDRRKLRFMNSYNLSSSDAETLINPKELGDYFEECMLMYPDSKTVFNWIMGELSYHLNTANLTFDKSPVSPSKLIGLLKLIDSGTISGKMAKEVFEVMFSSGRGAEEIIEEKGLTQIVDQTAIEAVIDEVIKENPKIVEEYKSGKERVFGFLVGQVMKKTRGQANPKLANDLLRSKISR
jgi:aspartyl-tRNA(Asn)/glutamyl-tRNA(Gln) amidotransferase subunit B